METARDTEGAPGHDWWADDEHGAVTIRKIRRHGSRAVPRSSRLCVPLFSGFSTKELRDVAKATRRVNLDGRKGTWSQG